MYEKRKHLWQKHLDFTLLDLCCLILSYVLSYLIRHKGQIFFFREYLMLGFIFAFTDLCVGFLTNNYKNIIRRGYYEEFKKVIFKVTLVAMIAFTFLFILHISEIFSRTVLLLMWFINLFLTYIVRIVWKNIIRKRMLNKDNLQKMIIITKRGNIKKIMSHISERKYNDFCICGIILSGKVKENEIIEGIPILGNEDNLEYVLQHQIVDEVFIDLKQNGILYEKAIECCEVMGITYHLNLGIDSLSQRKNAIIEHFAGYTVMTSSMKIADSRQLLIKRGIDILGALVGLALTIVIMIIIGPIIYIQSPGPIFFSQKRVGRNGRVFKIYKFRSMYLDAEDRKAELLNQNKMHGFMFKIDNDPRIIPIGKLIRKTSLDEFPQFFNVLKGEMSLVGTRPPTVDEYQQYEKHHKARLAMKPGITGMWQVSGRSDIIDFEEVVKLDRKYIEEWNLGLDIKIILQTLGVVLSGKGSV